MRGSISRRAALLGSAATFAATATRSPAASLSASATLPRRVLALYDSAIESRLKETSVHSLAAMPLEWLGLVLEYHDVQRGLPPIWDDPSCRGVLTWFPEPNLADYASYVSWIERAAAAGRRIVQIGDAAPKPGTITADAEASLRSRLFAAFGIRALGQWSAVTLGDRILSQNTATTEFECRFDAGLPAYELYLPARGDAMSWFVVERADQARSRSHLVIVSAQGGFVAPGYAIGTDPATSVKQWFVDPFAFFAKAFGTADLPAPDTTTLCGRRVYYSHIDGDGWRSISQTRALDRAPATNAEIILRSVVAANPDLPVTVAPIAAEMDPAFAGDLRALAAARALFRLDQVEAATHTYTHPFRWSFFEHYDPAAELPFRDAYQSMRTGRATVVEAPDAPPGKVSCCGRGDHSDRTPPRAFGGTSFDLAMEIQGSAQLINAVAAPTGKRVRLLQWPGDCTPFPAALSAVAQAGLLNINGGDTRCDSDFPSVSAIAPIGFQRDGQVQIYASNSSEELYTDLWTDRFFGFRDLQETWERTGSPRRLKPLNLYYHMYSGERRASLDALLDNLRALRQRGDFLAVFASRFAALAEGFFSVTIVPEGPAAWRVHNRGALQTIRFPEGAGNMLDLRRAVGVLGERVINGELYVALDPVELAPLIVLTPRRPGPPLAPILVQSSWELSALSITQNRLTCTAQGFGVGAMEWLVPTTGVWRARAGDFATSATVGADLALRIELATNAVAGIPITLERDT